MELQIHLAELLTMISMAVIGIVAAVKVIRAADRVGNLLKDFPPHRHIGDTIVYPDGYGPPISQRLSRGASQ